MGTGFFQAKEIIDNLWIGSSADARDPKFMKKHHVQLIINCTKSVPFSFKNIMGYRVAIDDDASENDTLFNYFPVTSRIIDEALDAGKVCLVHCYAGISRSSSIVAAYLMYKLGISHNEAIRIIQEAKNETFRPRPVFEPALKRYFRTM